MSNILFDLNYFLHLLNLKPLSSPSVSHDKFEQTIYNKTEYCTNISV